MKKFFKKLVMASFMAASVMWLAACGNGSGGSGNISVVPVPDSVEMHSGVFVLNDGATVGATTDSLKPAAEYLASLLSPATGYDIKAVDGTGTITLEIGDVEGPEGAYEMKVTGSDVTIKGNGYNGVIAGIQTFRQMLPAQIESKQVIDTVKWEIPQVNVTDAPAFQWRGIMLDVSRHFYTVDEVKELLDVMALYKMNRFHWHLTDDQGWRVEIKKYPKLTEKQG